MLHENGPWTVENGTMIDHKYSGKCLNDVAIMLDMDDGTLMKIGTPDFILNYVASASKAYANAGQSEWAKGFRCIQFNRYGFLDIDDICTLVNYLQNCIGPEKTKELFAMQPEQLKAKIKTLQNIGF